MCVSLEASLLVGAALTGAGVASVQKAWRDQPSLLLFACFPLVFGVHQFIEAAVWTSVVHPFPGAEAFRYLYTGVAFLVWPVLTPAAAALADERRRGLWTRLCGLGVAMSIYLFGKLALADGIALVVVKGALAYDPLFERPPMIVDAVYLALAVFPLVSMRNHALAFFGWAVFATFLEALLQNRAAWYSVWCFSAAVFSVAILLSLRVRSGRNIPSASVSR